MSKPAPHDDENEALRAYRKRQLKLAEYDRAFRLFVILAFAVLVLLVIMILLAPPMTH